MDQPLKTCSLGIWDTTVPGITFDENGVSNYARIQQRMMADFPRGEKGLRDWEAMLVKIRKSGKNKRYDCIIGVSGGTDSSYLLHIAKENGLRPLAVNLDNGWNSEISYSNIQKVTSRLNIDLETYVIDYEEIKDLLVSYMKASLPWIDNPTDLAIHAVLYKIASKEKIKYIFVGNDFRSEGKQPTEWTYSDFRQLRYINKKFGTVKINSYPTLTFLQLTWLGYIRGIKLLPVFNFINYQKKEAQQFLRENFDWEYYGGHHHENIFTKFAIAYWLPGKFNIDKRKITLSAQILSGEISREKALEMMQKSPYKTEDMEQDRDYVIKKLGLNLAEFEELWARPNKTFLDYPSYYPMIKALARMLVPILKYILPVTPKMFYEMKERRH